MARSLLDAPPRRALVGQAPLMTRGYRRRSHPRSDVVDNAAPQQTP